MDNKTHKIEGEAFNRVKAIYDEIETAAMEAQRRHDELTEETNAQRDALKKKLWDEIHAVTGTDDKGNYVLTLDFIEHDVFFIKKKKENGILADLLKAA